jgi:CO/xanthine dehydrogenase FAD-binding subunit
VPLLAVCIRTTFQGDRFTETRVAINNIVAFARRDLILEKFLNESLCSKNLAIEALNHLDTSIYDTRSDDYKKSMFRTSLKSAVAELTMRHKK